MRKLESRSLRSALLSAPPAARPTSSSLPAWPWQLVRWNSGTVPGPPTLVQSGAESWQAVWACARNSERLLLLHVQMHTLEPHRLCRLTFLH